MKLIVVGWSIYSCISGVTRSASIPVRPSREGGRRGAACVAGTDRQWGTNPASLEKVSVFMKEFNPLRWRFYSYYYFECFF